MPANVKHSDNLEKHLTKSEIQARREAEAASLAREKKRQRAVLEIRKKFGKNAVVRGMDLLEGATARDRNRQIGGHKA